MGSNPIPSTVFTGLYILLLSKEVKSECPTTNCNSKNYDTQNIDLIQKLIVQSNKLENIEYKERLKLLLIPYAL